MMDDDVQFEQLLLEKRHKELIATIKTLIDEVAKSDRDSRLSNSIERQVSQVEELTEIMRNFTVNEGGNDDVVLSIKEMQRSMLAGLKSVQDILNEPEEKKDEWVFTVKRNRDGFIESVTAKSK